MSLEPVDFIYRYNRASPKSPREVKDVQEARARLERGNRTFAGWVEACRTGSAPASASPFVIACDHLVESMGWLGAGGPKQRPYATVVGCSDARVPTELVLGQASNDLFVVRVAGNVIDAACRGSVEYALGNLGESLRVIVVLGHSLCGAVTGAVDAYLDPAINYWSDSVSHSLQSILRLLFPVVREAHQAIDQVWGANAESLPGHRAALIETTVFLNAAMSAFELQQTIDQHEHGPVQALYGVYNLRTGCVRSLPDREATEPAPNFAAPPRSQEAFGDLARSIASAMREVILDPEAVTRTRHAPPAS